MLWLQLTKAAQKGDLFPNLKEVADVMGITEEQIYQLLTQLIDQKVVAIATKKDPQGRQTDAYDLMPMFSRLEQLQKFQEKKTELAAEEDQIRQLYQSFEKEFNRALSPIEMQMIGQWLDQDAYAPGLIQLALKEAVLNQAYNLKYVDRVLLSWERKNIRTPQEVQAEQKKRNQLLLQKEVEQTEPLPKISLHNWLDGQDS